MGKRCLRDSSAFFLFFRASGMCPHFLVSSGISGNFLFFTRLSKVRYNVLAKDENFMFSYFFFRFSFIRPLDGPENLAILGVFAIAACIFHVYFSYYT